MKVPHLITCGLVALSIFLACACASHAEPAAPPAPDSRPASLPSDKVAATVNDEPIYESELIAALPEDSFEDQLDDVKKAKLTRLIQETVEAQYLKDHKVAPTDDELKQGMKDFERMVQTPGCPCCGGGYASIEQFIRVNAFSTWELRLRVTCDVGLKLYVERLTREQTSAQALAEVAKKRRTQVEEDYIKGYAISFRYMQDRTYFGNEKAVEARKESLANDALARLKKGDAFETVAKNMSDDAAWASKGGALGCVRPDFLGPEVEQVFRKLAPGTYSPVVRTTWGYCIVMRKALTEEDIQSVLKDQATTYVQDQVFEELKTAQERAKIQYSPAAASAPAAGAR